MCILNILPKFNFSSVSPNNEAILKLQKYSEKSARNDRKKPKFICLGASDLSLRRVPPGEFDPRN